MKQKIGRKLLGFLLALAMVVGLMPGMGLTAYAATSWSESFTTNGGTIDGGVTVSGSITLTIPEGKTLTVNGGINASGNTLTVAGTGTLVVNGANGTDSSDSWGGVGGSAFTGNLIVNGATVNATGGTGGTGGNDDWSGLPGGNGGAGVDGSITVQGGSALVNGGSGGNGGQNDSDPGGNGSPGKAVTGTITGSAQHSDNGNSWSAISGTTSTKRYVKVAPPSHTHVFTYSASGATITATCGAQDCTLTDSKTTLTLTAPTLTTYGEAGKSAEATLTGLGAFKTATGLTIAATDIKYVGRDGTEYTESTTAPTNAGKYTATITLSGVKTAEGENKSVAASVDYSIKYSVTFNTNGGSEIAQQLVEAGESATRPTDPTREGNIFGGWFADADFAKRYVFDEVTENTTVYAKWGEHRVTWTVGKFSIQDVFTGNAPVADSNTTVNLAAETLKPDGATLSWKTETDVSGDVTHTAQFSFPVTLNANGGTINAGNVESYIYGTGATLPTDVTRAKYDFDGWYANSELTGTAVTQIGTTATGSKEFWAKWTAVYAVPATVTANNRTYDGTEKPLVTVTGTATGGEMQYALGTETEATQPYTTSIPTATDVGTYHVWYKVAGDANHNDTDPSCVTATIAEPTPEPTPTPAAAVAKVARPSTEASPARKTIAVSWKAARGAKSFQVQWRAVSSSKWTSKSVKDRTYTIKGLRRGTLYQVRVRGVAGTAKGDWSKASSRWLKAASKVRATAGKESGTVKVSWARDAKANDGCRVYVYARQGGKAVRTVEVAKGKTSATVKGLRPGKAYFVRVRPYRKASGTTFSGAISGYRAVRAAG